MTALNAFLTPSSIAVLTDGAVYDEHRRGIVVGLASKVILLPHINAVAAVAGPVHASQVVAVCFHNNSGSFDAAADALPDLARFTDDYLRRTFPEASRDALGFRAILAGWSEGSGAAQLFAVSNRDGLTGEGVPAFVAYSASEIVSPPVAGDWGSTIRSGGATAAGGALLDRQRQLATNRFGEGGLVGGFAQLTQVMKDRVVVRVLRRWPDGIGAAVGGQQAIRGEVGP